MIALIALGNRIWGEGSYPHWVGAFLMTMGAWINSGFPPNVIPVLFVCMYFFRMFTSAPWLHLESDNDWEDAILRGLALAPLIVTETYLQSSVAPMIFGVIAVFAIAVTYYLAGKQHKVEATALAECLVGVPVGLICFASTIASFVF